MSRHLRATTYLATALFTCLLLAGGVLAQSPSLTSDKADYAPGETATLTGTGFQAGESVTLQVLHADETPDTGEDHEHWTVLADENGNFVTTWHVCEDDCIGSTLKATADGQASGLHAETTFTDAVNIGSFTAGCSTPSSSFTTGTSVCAKTTGLGSSASGKIDWVDPNGIVVRTTNFTGVSGNVTDSFAPSGCGTWTLKVYVPATTFQASSTFSVTGCCTAPTFTACPSNTTVNNDPGVCTAVVNYTATVSGSPAPTLTYSFSGATTGSGNGTGSGSTFDKGTTTVTCTANNGCGTPATCQFTVTVIDNENPVFAGCPSDVTVYTGEGATSCLATASWTAPTASDNCGVKSFTSSHSPGATFPVGTTTVTYTAKDAANNQTTCSFNVTVVDNTPPAVSCPATGTLTASAGANCQAAIPTVSVTASDNCTPSGSLTITQSPAAGTLVDEGTHTITVTVMDAANNTATCTTDFKVTNDPPVITSVIGPTGPLALGSSASVTVNFTDESGQGHTCTFSWDDNTSSSSGPLGSGVTSASASHTYAAAGVYTVGVTVTDDCGASATSKFEFIVIYDPSAGFVTGGGWINSPSGAYTANPNLTGKASFGFVSKYKKGATTPTGETEFQFQAGNLNFHSTSYQWLVVSGCKAQYKGDGTINGAAGCKFLLTATDGQVSGDGGVDKFRIKITDANGVVYDNVPSASEDIDAADPQTLDGGSIVIHNTSTKKISGSDLESDEEFIPTEYAIYQNYPNPFNPTTQIQFDLPENSRVKIVIYNILGRAVTTLFDEEMSAGRYRQLWNGQDRSGQVLPSGIYIYRIDAKSASSDRHLNVVKRMVLVK